MQHGDEHQDHLYFGKSLNPLKTSNLEGLEVLDRFRGIRTLEGLEVLRDIRPGCSTCVQVKQFYTSLVISQQRAKSELRVPWKVEKQNAIKQIGTSSLNIGQHSIAQHSQAELPLHQTDFKKVISSQNIASSNHAGLVNFFVRIFKAFTVLPLLLLHLKSRNDNMEG